MAKQIKQGSGRRNLKQRVKTAKKRTVSQTRWLERQLNDPYVAEAKRQGLRSRAAFKLAEIDDKHKLLRAGHVVVDLGAAPGGWSLVAAKRVKSMSGRHGESTVSGDESTEAPAHGDEGDATGGDLRQGATEAAETGAKPAGSKRNGQVVAIDISEMEPIPGVEILHLDFMADEAPDRLKALLRDGGADVVLSDMAAPSTGHSRTDHLRIMGLAEAAVMFASEVLRPGGSFLCKVLQGGTERDLLNQLKREFAVVKHVKPEASRADSAELYVLATGFRGG